MRLLALTATVAVLASAGTAAAETCSAPLKPALEVDLYFGRDRVNDVQWGDFLAEEVTPRFPEGLSVLDVAGQWRDPSGRISHENSKLLILIVFDVPAHGPKVEAVIAAFKKRFNEQSVLRVERAVCAVD